MKLSKNYFDVLTYIEENQNDKISQRKISGALNMSLGTINKIMSDLTKDNLIEAKDGFIKVTEEGYNTLEPFRVKRAILLAAGFGSRMIPITLNTPKPLVLVHGKRIIETILDALLKVGIEEIYIVRGYLGEQFDVLLKKYPSITLIDNPMYNETNNLSSAYLTRDKFSNSYVMEADLYIHNPSIIKKYQYGSNYTGKYVDVTDDWCFDTKNGYISKLKIGGEKCFHTYCIAYFSKEDGEKMQEDIKKSFELPGAKEKVWDFVALDYFKDHYKLYVREVHEGDIDEIDTFNELKKIDSIYDV